MHTDCILLRYGELALKGKNKVDFENRLVRNIQEKLKGFHGVRVRKEFGRLFVDLHGQAVTPVVEQLKDVFGLVGFSPAYRVTGNIEHIEQAALSLMKSQEGVCTFKVHSRVSCQSFAMGSQEMNAHLGRYLLTHLPEVKVDVHHPDLRVHVEVRDQGTYIYGNDIKGLGGLPVGASGKVALLLSGGIDSPVAGYLALKRGAQLECIHFHSYPFTSQQAQQKVIDLARILTRYGGRIRLHMVPFTEIQTEIKRQCPEAYGITLLRRMMVRIAETLAAKNRALALLTGESLGQVASQTLESMNTIYEVSKAVVLRPLVGMDKQEIIRIAKEIDTYETSILPFEDCCTLFLPKSPKTKPDIRVVKREEEKLDVERWVLEALEKTEKIDLYPGEEELPSYFL